MMNNTVVMMMNEVKVDNLLSYRRYVPQLKGSLRRFVECYEERENQKVAQAQGMNLRIS